MPKFLTWNSELDLPFKYFFPKLKVVLNALKTEVDDLRVSSCFEQGMRIRLPVSHS